LVANLRIVLKLAYKDNLITEKLSENAEYIKEQETYKYLTRELNFHGNPTKQKSKHMAIISA
jgi:hypothetical protein